MKEKIKPHGEYILIKIVPLEKEGVIVTTDMEIPNRGMVIKLGRDYLGSLTRNDIVIFKKFSGYEVESKKHKYLLLKDEDVLAVVE